MIAQVSCSLFLAQPDRAFFLTKLSLVYGASISPSPKKGHGKVAKKGHGKVAKKGHFQCAAACQKGTFSARRQANGHFF